MTDPWASQPQPTSDPGRAPGPRPAGPDFTPGGGDGWTTRPPQAGEAGDNRCRTPAAPQFAPPPQQVPPPQQFPQGQQIPQTPGVFQPQQFPPPGHPAAHPGQAVVVHQAVPRPQLAVVTWSLIALCCAVYVAELLVPGFFDMVALSPSTGAAEPWRFLTSAFAHSIDPAHLGFNMLALWSVGRVMERVLGRGRFLALYLLSALAGGIAYVAMVPPSLDPSSAWAGSVVGASGAVFGLFGGLIPLYRKVGASLKPILTMLAINVALVFVMPNIAWQSHLGGFLAGLVGAWALLGDGSRRGRRGWTWLALEAVVLAAIAVAKYAAVPWS